MTGFRPVWADVDLGAIRSNVRALAASFAPADVCAVVKADGYGHGAREVARAAIDAGATSVAVALVEEAVELRDDGLGAPILLLSEPVPEAAGCVVARDLTPVVYTAEGIEALATAAARAAARVDVHLKVDTGMHRVGCAPDDAARLAALVVDRPELRLAGVCTHFAVADEPDSGFTAEQVRRFDAVLRELRARGLPTGTVHASNTAGGLALPSARYDLVRSGIGIYGITPSPALSSTVALEPAMSFRARVSHVQVLEPGERISYGLRYATTRRSRIATVPAGYADGVPRELSHHGGEVLVRGVRCPIAGTVTMDQLMVDVGDLPVEVGEEVVLLGRQGDHAITAHEWADHLGTIPYTIVCGIGPRVPRRYR